MTHSHDPSQAASRMHSRARCLLERAERIQDLHGQAQGRVLARGGSALPAATGALDPMALLGRSAGQAVHDMHLALRDAARQANVLVQSDAQIARLNARIHGTAGEAPPVVIDVDAVEVMREDDEAPANALPPAPPADN